MPHVLQFMKDFIPQLKVVDPFLNIMPMSYLISELKRDNILN